MLKLLAPLKIKAKTTYIRDPEAFYHRIIGGYSLMSLHIDAEDLLHITSTPPEIYVAEGGEMTGIYTNSRHNEVNINKVNILNNVLNRIFLSADIELTYQDRVFITDMLYKLGIKDDRKFMKAFYRIAQETENTNALINAYFEKGSNFIKKVKELELIRKEFSQTSHSTQETQKDNYLYNSVMKRLMTGNIYRIVSNFNRSVQSNEIDAREFALSDQTYTSGNILLNMLREQSGEASDELVFINNNTYEDDVISEITESKSIKSIVNSAVLMDILKTIYHTAYDKFHENSDTYYRFEDTFYKASEQTILKLVSKVENNFFKSFETEKLIERASKLSESKLELLVKEISPGATDEEIQSIAENITIYNLLNEKRRLLSEKINQQDKTESEIFEPETDQIPLATGENEEEKVCRIIIEEDAFSNKEFCDEKEEEVDDEREKVDDEREKVDDEREKVDDEREEVDYFGCDSQDESAKDKELDTKIRIFSLFDVFEFDDKFDDLKYDEYLEKQFGSERFKGMLKKALKNVVIANKSYCDIFKLTFKKIFRASGDVILVLKKATLKEKFKTVYKELLKELLENVDEATDLCPTEAEEALFIEAKKNFDKINDKKRRKKLENLIG